MPEMKTVLMIAPYFVPRRRVGAVRPFRFAINLKRYGYRPVIMTIGHKPELLTPAEKNLLSGVPMISIETGIDRTTRAQKKENFYPQDDWGGITEVISNLIDRQTPVDTWIYLFLIRWRWIKNEALRVNPDIIWATGDPWSGLWLGRKLAKTLNKPFVTDFRDTWTLANVGLRERSRISGWIDEVIEKRVIRTSDFLVFTSEETRALYSDHYQLDKNCTAAIYNTFDPISRLGSRNKSASSTYRKGVVQIHFFGRFRRLSPAQPIIEILKKLRGQRPEIAGRFRIHSYGTPDPDQLNFIERAGLSSQFIFEDVVSPEEAQKALKSADLLLLSTHHSRRSIIPAKLWDYLGTGKPIFSIVPNPEVEKILADFHSSNHFTVGSSISAEDYLSKLVVSLSNGENDSPSASYIEKLESRHGAVSRTKLLAGIFDLLSAG